MVAGSIFPGHFTWRNPEECRRAPWPRRRLILLRSHVIGARLNIEAASGSFDEAAHTAARSLVDSVSALPHAELPVAVLRLLC